MHDNKKTPKNIVDLSHNELKLLLLYRMSNDAEKSKIKDLILKPQAGKKIS